MHQLDNTTHYTSSKLILNLTGFIFCKSCPAAGSFANKDTCRFKYNFSATADILQDLKERLPAGLRHFVV